MQFDSQVNQAVKKVWGFWATVGFGLAIMVVFLLIGILAGIVLSALEVAANPSLTPSQLMQKITDIEGLLLSVSTFATGIIGVGLILLFVKLKKGTPIAEYLGLKRISFKTTLLLIVLTLGIIVVGDLTSYLLGRPLNPESMVRIYETSVVPALLWIAVIVFAPAFEETFFRGFLFEGFRYSRISVIGAVILTSLFWSMLHVQYELYEITWIFATGIVMGIVRHKTGSLWSPLLMHAFMNLVASIEVAININSLVG